jgi:2-dehydro-3-deoxyphosphogalactonate aldolase
MACWDIIGKVLGKPIYAFLGGKYHERLRSYTYMEYDWPVGSPPEMAGEVAARLVEQGFTAVKLDPIFPLLPQPREVSLEQLRYAGDVFRHIREAVGERCDILLGTHGQMTTHSAIRLAKALEPYDPLWFEEPVPPENMDELARVARSTSIPIATGERLVTRWEFLPLLEKQAAQIIQVNVGVNGILESKKIASLAEAYYAQIAPWVHCGPVAAAATVQVDTCSPNFLIQEGLQTWTGFDAEIVKEPIIWENGYIIPPDRPGLGVELDEKALSKYPPNNYASPEVRRCLEEAATRQGKGR